MRIGVAIFIAAVMLTSCIHLNHIKNNEVLEQVQPGDTRESVFDILGLPDFSYDITDQRFIAYYHTEVGHSFDSPITITKELYTPIAFENGIVVAVGDDVTEVWTRQREERLHQLKSVESEEYISRLDETTSQEQIDALEKAVKPVPASNAALNLKLYRRLLYLDPDNVKYQKKVAFYEMRLARQKATHRERANRKEKAEEIHRQAWEKEKAEEIHRQAWEKEKAEEIPRQAWEVDREARNKKLRKYTGNGTAIMAVQDLGDGSLYVWVKNVGKQNITIHPNHFTLVDNDNKTIRCEISDSLDSVLEPGSISHGKINYRQEVIPGELIFQNRQSGRISKVFQ
jgi:outer membrane protein assembly factor BamE (lipoprotein component of BamABCDE complex)